MEDQGPVPVLADADAIESQAVQVHVESQARVEALYKGDDAAVSLLDATEAEQVLGPQAQRATELAHEGAQHRSAQLAVVAAQVAQPPRQRADPLANPHLGQHVLHQVHGRVRHAATKAGRTEAASFTRERHELRPPAAAAHQVQAPMLEPSAPQVLLELSHYESGQPTGLFRPLLELRPVPLDRLVQDRQLGLVPAVAGGRPMQRVARGS